MRSILLMLTTISLLTVIGTRIITIPIEEWLNVIVSGENINFTNRSAIGGLLFGLVGLLISQRLFGFNKAILVCYAWAVPVGLGIQKIGCFINGCCFGKPSELLWAVQYPNGSHAHYSQWSENIISSDAAYSLSVHPVQLYEMIGLFSIGYLVWSMRNYWKKNLSALMFSFFMFLIFRFLMEFIRDPASSQFDLNYVFNISIMQWILLSLGLTLGIVLLVYENYLKTDIIKNRVYSSSLRTDILYILTISFVLYGFNNLFTKYELIAVWIKFIPAVLLTLYYILTNFEYKRYRLVLSLVFLIPFYVMAQSTQNDSIKVVKYKQIDLGGSFGDFFNEVNYNPQQNECGGTSYTSEYYKNSYTIGGLGFSQVSRKGTTENTYGVNLHGGNIKTTRLATNEEKSNFIFGVNPYFKHESKWVGIGAGAQIGSLRKNSTDKVESVDLSDASKKHTVLPEFYFRLGRRDWLDVDYNYGFLMPSAFPTIYGRLSVGSSFGLSPDYSFRYGKIYPIESNFISAKGLITDRIGVNVMFVFKEKNNYYNENFNTGSSGKIVFGLNYRFGHKNE